MKKNVKRLNKSNIRVNEIEPKNNNGLKKMRFIKEIKIYKITLKIK